MRVDPNDIVVCRECKEDVVQAKTTRKSKGEYVYVLLDVAEVNPDLLSLNVQHQWMLTKVGEKFHAGQPQGKSQRAAWLANGINFHLEHVCKKVSAFRR